MQIHRVDVSRRVAAPSDAVWEAWADPGRLAGWFVGEADAGLEEARRVSWRWCQFGLTVAYDVVEVDPRRAFELKAAMADGTARTLRVELEALDSEATEVRVAEWGLSDQEEERACRSGWEIALGILELYLERYRGRERRSFLLMAPVSATPAVIRDLYRTGSGIASWLGATDALPGEGERFRIRLDAGGTITGRVLRVTEHEAAITWDEVEGVLELKVCPGPDEVFVALRVSSWSREKDLEEERAVLSGALDRLLERARELTREPA